LKECKIEVFEIQIQFYFLFCFLGRGYSPIGANTWKLERSLNIPYGRRLERTEPNLIHFIWGKVGANSHFVFFNMPIEKQEIFEKNDEYGQIRTSQIQGDGALLTSSAECSTECGQRSVFILINIIRPQKSRGELNNFTPNSTLKDHVPASSLQ